MDPRIKSGGDEFWSPGVTFYWIPAFAGMTNICVLTEDEWLELIGEG
jgi:hypothetical protein